MKKMLSKPNGQRLALLKTVALYEYVTLGSKEGCTDPKTNCKTAKGCTSCNANK